MFIPKSGHYIDTKAWRIVSVTECSRRFLGYLDEQATLELLVQPDCEIMIWETNQEIRRVDLADRESTIASVTNHVPQDPEDFNLNMFPSGYCYLPMHWKCDGGKPLIVLHLQH